MTDLTQDDLNRARDLLGHLGDLGSALAAASRPLAHLHDRHGAQLGAATILSDPSAFATTLRHALPGLDPDIAARIWGVIVAHPDLAAAFEVVLLRALDPLAGLLTYPDAVIYNAEQLSILATIDSAPRQADQPSRGSVTGIVKVTRICNLRCTYCHDWQTGPDAVMDFATLAQTMRWLIEGSNARRVNVVLHGGEPSLIGPHGLILLLALQARYRRPGQQIGTRMQTNGVRLLPALLDVLVLFDVITSVSMDGPPEVHDLTRRTVGGRSSSAAVRTSIVRLRDAGILNGILIVVTPALIAQGAKRLMSFCADAELDQVALLPMRPAAGTTATPDDTLPTAEFCRFMLEVDSELRATGSAVRVRELDAMQAALLQQDPQTCELQGFCVGHYFSIEPNGSVSHCDKFLGDQTYVLGRIDQPFTKVANGPAAVTLRAQAARASQAKSACPWWKQCRGWCPHEDYVARQNGQSGDCCGLAPLFEGLDARALPRANPAEAAHVGV
ncbi:MAG: radical SAM protein [bacterium]